MPTFPILIKKYFDIALAALPIEDYISCDHNALMSAVRHSVLLYASMPVETRYSEDIFIKYVLPLRVNDEKLEYNREFFYALLKERVFGMSLHDAAVEVNLWCAENASYTVTDDTTQSALEVYRSSVGRCGEEVTFTVCALRAVGIPARQCYAPFWAHCDDNHAWVEVFVDNSWHYMGACEPEQCLDRAWFTHAASRAPFIRARALTQREHGVYELVPVTNTYAECTTLTVFVTDGKNAVIGASVSICTVNYCRLRTLVHGTTDEHGKCTFSIGIGDVFVLAQKGETIDILAVCPGMQAVNLCLNSFSSLRATAYTLCPPLGHLAAHSHTNSADFSSRLFLSHTLLAEKNDSFYSYERALAYCAKYGEHGVSLADYLHLSRGNYAEMLLFFDCDLPISQKLAILSTLRTKDLWNVSASTMYDCAVVFQYAHLYSDDIFKHYVLCPRASDEQLFQHRSEILRFFAERDICFTSGADVISYLSSTLRDESKSSYPGLVCRHIDSLNASVTTAHSLPFLFVCVCRTFGIAARISTLDRAVEYWQDGDFVRLTPNNAFGCVTLTNDGTRMEYGADFTVSSFGECGFQDIDMSISFVSRAEITLPVGKYMALCSRRQIDGTTAGNIIFFDVQADKNTEVYLPDSPDLSSQKLLSFELSDTNLLSAEGEISLLSCIHSDTILAWCEFGAEPTEHFLSELLIHENALVSRNIQIVLLSERTQTRVTKHPRALSLPFVRTFFVTDPNHIDTMRGKMGIGDLRLPFITAVRANYECLFSFANYNVGTVPTLMNLF